MSSPTIQASTLGVMRHAAGGHIHIGQSGGGEACWLSITDADGDQCKVGLPWQSIGDALPDKKVSIAAALLTPAKARLLASMLVAWATDAEEDVEG
jgi:hypothetical protein